MTRYLNIFVFVLALALTSAFPVEEVPKDDVPSDQVSEPIVDEKSIPEPEVHEPVPAEPVLSEPVPKISEPPQENVKDEPLPVEEAPKGEVPVSSENHNSDKNDFIDSLEWRVKAGDIRNDKFDTVHLDGNSRISPEELPGQEVPAEPQEKDDPDFDPAKSPEQPPPTIPYFPSDNVGRSAEAKIDVEVPEPVVPQGSEPLTIVQDVPDVLPAEIPVVPVDADNPAVIVEPIAAASDEDVVAIVEDSSPVQPIPDGTIVEDFKPVVVEERADSVPEDVEDQVSEQKDPVLSDEVKSEEVKSEEVKSGESKSDEVKSDEVVSDEVKSIASRSDEAKSVSEENKSEDVKSEVSKSEEVKSEELKPLEDKADVPKGDVLKSGDIQKDEVKPEVPKVTGEEGEKAPQEKAKDEPKVTEEAKVVEVVKEEPAKVAEDVKKPDVVEDLSPSNQIRV